MNPFNILTSIYNQFINAVPDLLGAIVMVLLGWIIAKAVSKILLRIFRKIGIDRLGDTLNNIELVHNSNMEIQLSAVLAKVFYYIIFIVFFIAATDVLDMSAVSNLMSNIIEYIPLLISASIVLVIGLILADFLKNVALTALRSFGIPSANLIASFVFWFIFITVLISALTQAQVDTRFITSNLSIILAGIVFAFSIGYGLASRSMMSNFLASFYSRKRFKVGDRIAINGMEGEIVEMDNVSLVLRSGSKRVIIPMSKLSTENVEIFGS